MNFKYRIWLKLFYCVCEGVFLDFSKENLKSMGCCVEVQGMEEDLSHLIVKTPALVVDTYWIAPKLTTLRIKERVLSLANEYMITNIDCNEHILKVHGKQFSLYNALLKVSDLSGNVIAILAEKTVTGSNMFEIQDSKKQVLAVMTKKYAFSEQLFEIRSPAPESILFYTVNGTVFGHRYVIRNVDDQIVAKCGRDLLQISSFDKYGLIIGQGVDVIAMICICCSIDEYNEHKEK